MSSSESLPLNSSSSARATYSGTAQEPPSPTVAFLEAPNDVARIDESVKRVKDTFNSGVTKPLEWRLGALRALRAVLTSSKDEIESALFQDLRKSSFDVWLAEYQFLLNEIDEALGSVGTWMKPTTVNTNLLNLPGASSLVKDPLGAVLIIAPWNYPLQLLVAPLIGALAAGDTAVLKPSELAPHTSAWTAKYLRPAMAAWGVEVIEGGIEPTSALLKKEFAHIFYTGSGHVGKVILRAAAEYLTPCTLELGGKSPAIVLADANLEVTARRLAWGKGMNAGQTCVAPDYILVEDSVHDQFVARLKAEVANMYGSDPKQSADYGRIINQAHSKRLAALVTPLEEGLEAAIGDVDTIDTAQRYVPPIFLTGARPDHRVMADEIFGPILPIMRASTVAAAFASGEDHLGAMISFVNSRPKPLALYVFTGSDSSADRVLRETSSGGAVVNDCIMHLVNCSLPFGGVGPSGMGSYHGEKSFSIFSHEKSVLRRPGAAAFDVPQRYAPYTADKEAFMKRMMVLQRLGLYKHWWYLLVGAGAAALIAIFVTKFGARLW